MIQITWRPTYLKVVDPLLKAAGYPSCDNLREDRLGQIVLTDRRVYLPMVKAYFATRPGAFATVNDDPPGWAALARAVNGGRAYSQKVSSRCDALLAAMKSAGWEVDAATQAQGLDGGAPTASVPELLELEATTDRMEDLKSDAGAFRDRFVQVFDAFDGFGHGDTPPGRRAAYGDIIAWGEDERMRAALLQKTAGNSSCGLVIRTAWRLLGVRDPLLDPPYKLGTVIANLVEYARKCGARMPAKTVGDADRGDVILVVRGDRQHIFTVVKHDGASFESVDGGQPSGDTINDDGTCNGIHRRTRTLAADRRTFPPDDREVYCWIDVSKLTFQEPIIQPVSHLREAREPTAEEAPTTDADAGSETASAAPTYADTDTDADADTYADADAGPEPSGGAVGGDVEPESAYGRRYRAPDRW